MFMVSIPSGKKNPLFQLKVKTKHKTLLRNKHLVNVDICNSACLFSESPSIKCWGKGGFSLIKTAAVWDGLKSSICPRERGRGWSVCYTTLSQRWGALMYSNSRLLMQRKDRWNKHFSDDTSHTSVCVCVCVRFKKKPTGLRWPRLAEEK